MAWYVGVSGWRTWRPTPPERGHQDGPRRLPGWVPQQLLRRPFRRLPCPPPTPPPCPLPIPARPPPTLLRSPRTPPFPVRTGVHRARPLVHTPGRSTRRDAAHSSRRAALGSVGLEGACRNGGTTMALPRARNAVAERFPRGCRLDDPPCDLWHNSLTRHGLEKVSGARNRSPFAAGPYLQERSGGRSEPSEVQY